MRQRTHTIRLLLKYLLPSTLLLMSSIALAVTLNCDGVGCSFYVDFKNPGFYVIKATSPHQSNAGLWNLSLYLTTKTIPGGIHAGTTLMEDGITPGSIAFKLLSAQSISFRVWDYTQANVQVNVKVFQKRLFDECFDECLVYDNNVAVSENVITPQLQSGDYVIEVRALSNSTRSQFGISVEQPYVGDSLSVTGWLDASLAHQSTGFLAFYLETPQLVLLKMKFGESFGEVGAGKPDLTIDALTDLGEFQLYWQEPSLTQVFEDNDHPRSGSIGANISGDGRFVVFSEGTNTNNSSAQFYLYDTNTGEKTRISNLPDSTSAVTQTLAQPVISTDGKYIAFMVVTWSVGPMGGHTYQNIYLYDRNSSQSTRIARHGGRFFYPLKHLAISGDGRYITYGRGPMGGIGDRLLSYDRETGIETTLFEPVVFGFSMNQDGRYLVYESNSDVYVYDRVTGLNTSVSVLKDGSQIQANSSSPSVSADGRFVTFVSNRNIYIYDQDVGYAVKLREVGNISRPIISRDGRFLVFETALSLTENDNNHWSDIYGAEIRHRDGFDPTLRIGLITGGLNAASYEPSINSDGHIIGFMTDANNLTETSEILLPDMFLYNW